MIAIFSVGSFTIVPVILLNNKPAYFPSNLCSEVQFLCYQAPRNVITFGKWPTIS